MVLNKFNNLVDLFFYQAERQSTESVFLEWLNPKNKDSEIRKCPILNSEIFLILDILKADLYVSPCPACTCRPIFFA